MLADDVQGEVRGSIKIYFYGLNLIVVKFKGIVSKFWNFLYYWSDLTEIFTQ